MSGFIFLTKQHNKTKEGLYSAGPYRSFAGFSPCASMPNLCCVFDVCRTGPEAVSMNPPEPSKEKEKQGFFRAIKKKKKKSQTVGA